MIETHAASAQAALSAQPPLTITVMPDRPKLLLRGHLGNARFVAAVEAATGSTLPPINKAVGLDPEILWLAPTGWLLLGSQQRLSPLLLALFDRLQGLNGDVIDVSDEYAHLKVEGAATGDLLATCCPLDLSIPAFPQQSTARTMVASIPTIIHRASPDATLDLYVDRSYAEYLLEALEAQAVEFR